MFVRISGILKKSRTLSQNYYYEHNNNIPKDKSAVCHQLIFNIIKKSDKYDRNIIQISTNYAVTQQCDK